MDLSALAASVNVPVLSAFLLGLMATIGPCTMATNIAALAYISRKVTDRKYGVATGALYTLGRMVTYSLLGILIIFIGLEVPGISRFVQDIGEKAIGPFLIGVGLALLFIDKISFGAGSGRLSALGGKMADWGMIGGLPLGALFALAFCPYTAVLFFAVLIPLSLKSAGGIILPPVFAIGTGLPVLAFGVLLSLSAAGASSWLNALTRAERVIRLIVSVVFIGVGLYYLMQWLQS